MNNKTIIGIDPGMSGGYCYNLEGKRYVHKWVDAPDTFAILESIMTYCMLENREVHAYIEKVSASPIMGQSSAFKFGYNFGQWNSILVALRIPYTEVVPQKWQMGLNKPKDLKGAKLKRWLKEKAIEKFPKHKITLATCDALLLYDYGMKQ